VTDRFPKRLAALALVLGTATALYYNQHGLTLSHYDAKAHLVVARRVLDSLTPEYSQIGAVWLPLPHLLNLLPVQIDAFYRTGASAVAISILSFALACYAIAHLIVRITGSRVGAAIAVAMFALDPNVLYLQSTPMTEPLLFGLVLWSVALAYDWLEKKLAGVPHEARDATTASQASRAEVAHVTRLRTKAGWVLILACLTRYEAWLVTAAVLALSAIVLWRRGLPLFSAIRETADLAIFPVLAIVLFFFHSWFTTGAWFVTGGFYVPDNVAHGNVFKAVGAVLYGMRTLVGRPVVFAAMAGVMWVLLRGLLRPQHAVSLVVLSLVAFMALPAYAFYEGHPFRMRYIVAPTVAASVFVGLLIGLLQGRARHAAALVTIVWLAFHVNPLNAQAPMVQEAQWDVPFSLGRRNVTACLIREYHGEPILASMGSLAHYMQELSREGIGIRDFVHEGNLPYWQEAIESPKGRVGWIIVEERAEGGDMLSAKVRDSSAFTLGFTRVCADGGIALYKATKSEIAETPR
jgi:hypothetical protein